MKAYPVATPAKPHGLRLVALLSGLVVLSTLVPYFLHGSFRPWGMVHSGLEFNLGDQLSYLMWINQIRNGSHAVTNLFMHDLLDSFAPNPLWWLLGMVGRILPVSTVAIYHGARVLLGFGFLLAFYSLTRRLCVASAEAWVAWGLAATGGGLAWLLDPLWALFGYHAIPADAWMPELWAYPSIMRFPHFAAGLLLLTGCLLLTVRGWEEPRTRWPIGAGLLLGLLALVHTYTAVTLVAVMSLHILWSRVASHTWRPVLPANAGAIMVSAPFFAFQYWQIGAHPALKQWAIANITPSPPPWNYALGLGFIGVFAAGGMLKTLRWSRSRGIAAHPLPDGAGPAQSEASVLAASKRSLPFAWVTATVALIYSNLPFERRCVEGLHLAVCLLAAPVLVSAARRLSANRDHLFRLCAGGLLLTCALASVWHLWRDVQSPLGYVAPGVFVAEQTVFGLFGRDAKVLARFEIAQWLAVEGRVRVFVGHGHLTGGFEARRAYVTRFFDPRIDQGLRSAMLRELGCNVVVAAGRDAAVLHREGHRWRELYWDERVAVFVPREP